MVFIGKREKKSMERRIRDRTASKGKMKVSLAS